MMARDESRIATAPRPVLPDDTEESIVGTKWHQRAIAGLDEALEHVRREQHEPWDVATNLGCRGFPHPSGRPDYAPKPDVCIHRRTLPPSATEVRLSEYGPPLLIVEVASDSTWTEDVGAKARSYAQGGVADYMVVDVDGGFLPAPILAWHLHRDGRMVPWEPDAEGQWQTPWGFSLSLEDRIVRVYDAAGRRVPTFFEMHRRAHDLETQVAQMQEEIARLRGEQSEHPGPPG
jgi:Uma2 family endonuclease